MKGQSNLIDFVLSILFSVIILVVVAALAYSFYRNALTQDVTKSLNEVTLQISDAILKVYQQGKQSTASPTSGTSVLLATVNLNLPAKISSRNYEIDFVPINPLYASLTNVSIGGLNESYILKTDGAKIVARTTDDPIITVTKDLPNVDINIQGNAVDGINASLQYYRYNSGGTVYDKITLGNQQIIIDISHIS